MRQGNEMATTLYNNETEQDGSTCYFFYIFLKIKISSTDFIEIQKLILFLFSIVVIYYALFKKKLLLNTFKLLIKLKLITFLNIMRLCIIHFYLP